MSGFSQLVWLHVMPMAMPSNAPCPPELAGAVPREGMLDGGPYWAVDGHSCPAEAQPEVPHASQTGQLARGALGLTQWHGAGGARRAVWSWAMTARGDMGLLSPFGVILLQGLVTLPWGP